MREKVDPAGSEGNRSIRFAWWASFLATIALIALLGVARSAQAMTASPAGNPGAIILAAPSGEEEFEEGEEEFEAEECEAEEEEFEEEGEEEEFEAEECGQEEGAEAPRQCVLSSAIANVSASTASDKVRLAIRYTAFAPGSLQVLTWLRGSKGPLTLGKDSDHVGKKGVLRETESLTAAQMSKAAAAKSFTIQLRPAHAPRYCHTLLDRHLTVRHAAAGRLSWSDPELGYRSSRQP